jgi:hypothetical protein
MKNKKTETKMMKYLALVIVILSTTILQAMCECKILFQVSSSSTSKTGSIISQSREHGTTEEQCSSYCQNQVLLLKKQYPEAVVLTLDAHTK